MRSVRALVVSARTARNPRLDRTSLSFSDPDGGSRDKRAVGMYLCSSARSARLSCKRVTRSRLAPVDRECSDLPSTSGVASSGLYLSEYVLCDTYTYFRVGQTGGVTHTEYLLT